jgi:cold shock CspA family protein
MRHSGIVTFYKATSGFGFVVCSGKSHFFHIKQVRDSVVLEVGDTIHFDLIPGGKSAGELVCSDVELIARATLSAVR